MEIIVIFCTPQHCLVLHPYTLPPQLSWRSYVSAHLVPITIHRIHCLCWWVWFVNHLYTINTHLPWYSPSLFRVWFIIFIYSIGISVASSPDEWTYPRNASSSVWCHSHTTYGMLFTYYLSCLMMLLKYYLVDVHIPCEQQMPVSGMLPSAFVCNATVYIYINYHVFIMIMCCYGCTHLSIMFMSCARFKKTYLDSFWPMQCATHTVHSYVCVVVLWRAGSFFALNICFEGPLRMEMTE